MKDNKVKTSCKPGFTRNCHAEFISASTPLVTMPNKVEILNQVRDDDKRGFTLIELLVVVLIIAILAAVAVPQYRVAVEKSRVASDLALLRALAHARQVYRLSTGQYNCNLEELDVDFPYVKKEEKKITPYHCDNQQIEYTLKNKHTIRIGYSGDFIVLQAKDYYTIDYYTYGKKGNVGECYGTTPLGERVCKSFGKYSRGGSDTSPVTVYEFN